MHACHALFQGIKGIRGTYRDTVGPCGVVRPGCHRYVPQHPGRRHPPPPAPRLVCLAMPISTPPRATRGRSRPRAALETGVLPLGPAAGDSSPARRPWSAGRHAAGVCRRPVDGHPYSIIDLLPCALFAAIATALKQGSGRWWGLENRVPAYRKAAPPPGPPDGPRNTVRPGRWRRTGSEKPCSCLSQHPRLPWARSRKNARSSDSLRSGETKTITLIIECTIFLPSPDPDRQGRRYITDSDESPTPAPGPGLTVPAATAARSESVRGVADSTGADAPFRVQPSCCSWPACLSRASRP